MTNANKATPGEPSEVELLLPWYAAGTLDPDATGVLVAAVGRATRLMRFVVGADKVRETASNESTHSRVSSGSMSGSCVGSPSLMIE